jgi:hypothetical protein
LAAKENFGYTAVMADNVSDLGLKLNYWLLTNRQQLKKWWVILLLAVDIFILTICLTQGILLIFRFRDTGNSLNNIVQTTNTVGKTQALLTPKSLVQSSAVSTPSGLGRFDFSLRLENPNDFWIATATVQFQGGKNELTPVQVILPPKSVRYAMALDVQPASENEAPIVNYSLTEITWEKLTAKEVAQNNIDISVKNLVQTQTNLVSGGGAQTKVTQVTGEVVNKSFYTITGLRIAIILTNGTETIGVRSAIISKIKPETTSTFSVEWNTVLSTALKVEAFPEIYSGLIES